jgi:cytochrome c553
MMTKWTLLIAASLMVFAITAAQAAGDPAAGKAKSAMCAGCHGPNGQGVAPNPPLAGKSDAQLVAALDAYKSGQRPNPQMKAVTAGLSEQDVQNLAAYYSSLK